MTRRLLVGLAHDKNLKKFRSQIAMKVIELGIVVWKSQSCRIPIRNNAWEIRIGILFRSRVTFDRSIVESACAGTTHFCVDGI